MAKLLISATHGHDNASRATMPFFLAKGAKEAGIDVGIVLALDATVLAKADVRKHVLPHGQPPLEELYQFAREQNIAVYV
ncbi:MAG: hypothetical protein FJZ38_07540 [Candidatus Rokubacteria bacterium]|nr:hypothetical protein [Candidatus Rokubacteria bacterium]